MDRVVYIGVCGQEKKSSGRIEACCGLDRDKGCPHVNMLKGLEGNRGLSVRNVQRLTALKYGQRMANMRTLAW